MRDFYPEDMRLRDEVFSAWREAAALFGFNPYDACVVESLDLLRRKAGEEIVEQIYTFADKSGRELALRPEMTPSLARMVAARQGSLSFPLKWYAIAQCFRYERMSKGRKREHFQWNLDIIGEDSVTAESEVIATAVHALRRLGLGPDSVRVHYSSRALLAELLVRLGISPEHHPATFLALDKMGKLAQAEIESLLRDSGLSDAAISQVLGLLNVRTLDDASALLGPESPSLASLRAFEAGLAGYGMTDAICFDISVVRGLSYYTGIVFECFDTKKEFRAIFGGGRYDNLLSDLGGKRASGVGLGFGDVVVSEIIQAIRSAAPPVPASRPFVGVSYMADEQRPAALRVAAAYREAGIRADLALRQEKARNFFARVGSGGFTHAIYIGPDDITAEKVRVKNLQDRTETERPLVDPVVQTS